MYLKRYNKVIWKKSKLNSTKPPPASDPLRSGLRRSNFGDCKTLQEGVCELRIHYGPGIRIYYGKIGNKVILLLCGGDKGSQDRDITKAKEYLKDYQSREIGHGKK